MVPTEPLYTETNMNLLTSWLRRLLATPTRPRSHRRTLLVEVLEDRNLPSALTLLGNDNHYPFTSSATTASVSVRAQTVTSNDVLSIVSADSSGHAGHGGGQGALLPDSSSHGGSGGGVHGGRRDISEAPGGAQGTAATGSNGAPATNAVAAATTVISPDRGAPRRYR
jgi:hypothetical protein